MARGWTALLRMFHLERVEEVLPRERRFPVGDREVVVRELTLADLRRVSADLGEVLQRIATQHPDVDIEHFDHHLTALLPTLAGAIEELLGKLLGVPADYLMEHLTPLLTLQIVRAILEVNQVPLLREEIRRIAGLAATTALAG